MKSLKEVAKFLKEEVEFLTQNQNYAGGWLQLGNGLAVVVCWEPGWGDEKRDDCIQADGDLDYALCAGIKIYNPHDTPDYWTMLSNKEGDIVTETVGIVPDEDYVHLAKIMLQDFDFVKDVDYDKDGVIQEEVPNEEEVETSQDESLKEDIDVVSQAIYDTFQTGSDKFIDIVRDLVDRVDNYEDEEDIMRAIDDGLIYTEDQWEVMKHYQSPSDANFNDAMESLISDIFAICSTIASEKGE